MKCGVVVFPGSNCDHDVYHVLKHLLNVETVFLWHDDADLKGSDLVVLPGGFSYGDYLRAGAMAGLSPIVAEVHRHAKAGGLVLGICNGFQILLEMGLLPGAMRRNAEQRFLCRDVHLEVVRDDLPFTSEYSVGQVLRMPVAHAEGNYFDAPKNLDALEKNHQVVFRYCAPDGGPDDPNGSERAIAGICNSDGNVFGLMPHPERCSEELLGNADGLALFSAVTKSVATALEVGA
jgi:phosphoribosylformylglycinamidine synthase subunit PurQ / glutaminase